MERKQNWDIIITDLGIFNYHSSGFDIKLKKGDSFIKWADIERITAYKVDLLDTDEICMDIEYNNKILTITEEAEGWYQFIDRLKSELPSINVNWGNSVLEKPFEANLTIIYDIHDRQEEK